nr:hypothetical protein [uncultured Dongia sp.]
MSENPQPIGEEMLTRVMQYCDGVLDARETEIVAHEIAADPALQILARDLTLGATAAREALAPLINQPVPLAMARRITSARSTTPRFYDKPLYRQAAAALVGLFIGAAAMGLWSAPEQKDGLRLAGADDQIDGQFGSSAFRSALISVLSAKPDITSRAFALGEPSMGQGSVSVIRWFELASGTDCAEFRLDQPTDLLASGVACQLKDGGWELMTLPTAQE